METSEYTDRQKFISKDGAPLTGIRSNPWIADTEERYVLWSDILRTFHGIDHLETEEEYEAERILFMIDDDGELWQPLRIYHDPYRAYVVLYGDNQRQQTEESCNILQGSDDHGQGDSQNQAHSEIQPSLKDMFETCKYLYQHAKTAVYDWRGNFRQAIANTQYHHSMLVEEIERLDMAGSNTLVDGKSQEQILEELRDLEQQVPDWEYQRTCFRMLFYKNNRWSYATSSIFIALPSDLDSWDDSNTSTHQFRLYFMCDNLNQEHVRKDMPQHVHLSNHPGYLLQRQQEFFQKYGDYVLRMLLMAKRGYFYEYFEIPPLDTFKILWGCDPDVVGSHINKDTIGPLVDKAINYLQELFQPKWRTGLGLDRDQSAAIRTFLDVQDDHNSGGNLYRYIGPYQNVFWICQAHLRQHFDNKLLKELREFVQSRGGRVAMQQARLELELGSSTEAEQFRTLLKGCGHRFDISVKLTWDATRSILKELCTDIANTGTVVLELDGITLDNDSQGYDRSLHFIFNSDESRFIRLRFVTLINYPRRHEQSILLGRCLLQSVDLSAQSPHSWVELHNDLEKFVGITFAAQDPSDWNRVATFLQSTLEMHGIAGTSMVTMYGEGWSAVFDPHSGAVVKVHSQDTVCPEGLLSAGTITSLGVHVNSLQFDEGFFRTVQANALLKELNVSCLGHNVLYYAGHIIRMWHASTCACHLTLFDRVEGTHNRVVAQLAIGGGDSQSSQNSNLDVDGCDMDAPISQQQVSDVPVDLVLEEWDCDHVFSALSDYSASFLDMATKQHPSVLTMFTLDVSQLSQVGLSSIQEVFARSNLEQLHAVCTPVDSQSIAQVLGTVQWNTLKSLILSGDKIDEWCQLWPLPVSLRLLSLQIQGSSSTVQDLSHSSVLFLQQLIFSSPLVELCFRNVQFQDKRDWALLIDSLDLSLLRTLDLGEHGFIQFLAVPQAVDLFVSRLEPTDSEAEGPKLVMPSLILDITILGQTGIMHVQKIFSHCCLEKLAIKCDPIDINMLHIIAKLIKFVQWPLLELLRLSGNNINQWIQLLAKIDTPRLKAIKISGTKSVQQELSHENTLFIVRLIGTSTLRELSFEDVLLQDQRDWALLVEKMDPAMLENFYLGKGSYEQFLASRDAPDLDNSKWTQWDEE